MGLRGSHEERGELVAALRRIADYRGFRETPEVATLKRIARAALANVEEEAMGEETYRWATPYDWLSEAAQAWPPERLYNEVLNLARRMDSDALLAEYRAEMSVDGYFTPIEDGGKRR